MIIKTGEELSYIIKKIILSVGGDNRNAERLAESLVSAHLCGVDTHGIYHLPYYVSTIKSGELLPTNWPEIVSETKNSALIKGNFTFGQVTAKFAMECAIDKAKKSDVVVVSGVEVGHTGRLGEYAEIAASQKLISFMYSGGFSEEKASAVPFGGAKPVLGPNPMAMGFPAGKEPPIISDFATTNVAGSKVSMAREKNEYLPEGCLVDNNGQPTCDPSAYLMEGGSSLLPFGGHKGYMFMIVNEILGRIFSNADKYADKRYLGWSLKHSGFTMVVFKPSLFLSLKDYELLMDNMIKRIKAIPPAPGFEEVLVPGDIETKTREDRIKNGIPINDMQWKKILELYDSLVVKKI